jgi:hypothetical protein
MMTPPDIQNWLDSSERTLATPHLVQIAIDEGELTIAKWLAENGHEVGEKAVTMFAIRGEFDEAAWFLIKGGTIEKADIYAAVKANNIPAAQWLVEQGPIKNWGMHDTEWWLLTISSWELATASARFASTNLHKQLAESMLDVISKEDAHNAVINDQDASIALQFAGYLWHIAAQQVADYIGIGE